MSVAFIMFLFGGGTENSLKITVLERNKALISLKVTTKNEQNVDKNKLTQLI